MKGIFPLDLKVTFLVEGNIDGQPKQDGTPQQADTEVVWANSMLLSMRSQFFQSVLTWPKQEDAGVDFKEDVQGEVSAESGSKRRRGKDGQGMDVKHEGGCQPASQAIVIPVKESVQVYSDAADLEAAKKVIQLMHGLALPASHRDSDLGLMSWEQTKYYRGCIKIQPPNAARFLIKMLRWADMWGSPECIELCLNSLSEMEWKDLKQDDVEQLASLPETITRTSSYARVQWVCAKWLQKTFGAVHNLKGAVPRGYVNVTKQIHEVQQDQLANFCSLSLPAAQVFAGAAKPDPYTSYFLATYIWSNYVGEVDQEPSSLTPEALDEGTCLLSSGHINSLLSASAGVPPSLRHLCDKCLVQKFGDVQQVVVDPDLRASFCHLSFAAVKRWAASDDLVCTFGEHDIVSAVECWHQAQPRFGSPYNTKELASVVRLGQLSRSLRHTLPFFSWWFKPDHTAVFNAVYETSASTAPAAPQSNIACLPFPSAWTSPAARRSVPPATADARAEATVMFTHQQLSSARSAPQRSKPFYSRGSFWSLALELKEQGKLLWVSLAPAQYAGSASTPPAVRATFDISLQMPDGKMCPTQVPSAPRWFLGGQSVGGPALGEAAQAGRTSQSVEDLNHLLLHGEKSKKGLVFRCSISCVE